MSGTWTKPRHTAVRILRKKRGMDFFLCKGAFSPKKQHNFGFLLKLIWVFQL